MKGIKNAKPPTDAAVLLAVLTVVLTQVKTGRCAAVVGDPTQQYRAGALLKAYPTTTPELLKAPGTELKKAVNIDKNFDFSEFTNLRVTHVQIVHDLPILSVLLELEDGADAEAEALSEVFDTGFMELSTNLFRYTRLPAVMSKDGVPTELIVPSKLLIGDVPKDTPFPAGTKMPLGFVVSFVSMGMQVDVPALLDFEKLQVRKRTVDGSPLSLTESAAILAGQVPKSD